MDFTEVETKEDIMAVGELERALACCAYSGYELDKYLEHIERDVRYESEAGEEYYLICSGGPVGFFALRNGGSTVTVDKIALLPAARGRGLFRRTIDFIYDTYFPDMIKIRAASPCHAALALGFTLCGDYYEKRFR